VTGRLGWTFILLAVLLLGAAGCSKKTADINDTGVPAGTPVATSSVEATTAESTAEPTESNSTPADTSAIEKELAAIEKELEALSMPDDSDFSAIEGDLP